MGLFHRSRDKDGPRAVPKNQFGFRKSFKKFTGAKSTSLAPEPIAASVIRQSNTSERSPCNSIINDTFVSLTGSTAANESITTISPCRQVQVADGEPFLSGPDAKTDNHVVPIEELSNLHIDGTDISSLKQDTGLDETDTSSLKQDTGLNETDASNLKQDTRQRSIEVAQPDHIPCQYITNRPKTLWDRAYDALRSSNDPDKSDLITDYEGQVLQGLTAKMSGPTVELEEAYSDSLLDQTPTNKAVLDRAIEDALKHAGERSSARSFVDKAGNLASTLQNFIGEAVKASPEASLVWAGVCLVLPLLTQPAIADEAQRNGFSYVTSRIGFWTTLERQLANAGNWTESVQEEFVTLYQHLLEFQVRTVLRYHQGGFARFVQDLSSNVWEQLITVIKHQEGLLYQDLQQYHNANLSFTVQTLKENSNKSLESNARFLEALQEVQDFVRKGAENKLQEKEEKCLHLFRLTDNQRHVTYEWYKSRVQKRVEGTCIWAVQHENFQNWLKLKSGPLLITADPGCGKSVLSKYLIDQYLPQRFPTATICYFFFKDGDQNTVKQALCALLHQLFCQKPELIKHAVEECKRNGEGVVGTISALWGIFNNAAQDKKAGTIIIVLDALDECESTEFTSLVENLTVSRKGNVKLFLTSRPYGDVVFPFEHGDMLDRFPRVRIPGETDDHSDKISTEINMVIQVRVDEFAKRHRLNDQLKETLSAELCRTQHRTYLWVFLVFDHLETLMSSSMLKRTPQGFKFAMKELPRTVSDAYGRMLNRSGEAARVALRRALRVLLVAKRPLEVEEFKIVVNMESHITSLDELDLEEDDHDFEMRLRAMCGLFLSIHRKKVYFLHQTAREFLLAQSESSSALLPPYTWRHSISERQAHAELARVCVRYIYILDPEVVHCDSDYSRLAKEYPFLVYSSEHWSHHLRNSDLDDDIGFLITAMVLCEPSSKQFRTWTDNRYDGPGEFARRVSTSLHVAVGLGCHGLVQHLLRIVGAGAINARHSLWETTPLALAARHGHHKVMQLLIEAGAEVDAGWEERTPLYEAVKAGNFECVTILLNYGASVDQLDAQGRTLLHVAASNDDAEIVETLADKGIDINATDSAGDTALLVCSSSCDGRSDDGIKLARLLIERGACLDIANKHGTTALMQAVDKRNMKWTLAKLLIEKGADPNLRNCKGKLALHMVYYSDKDEDTAVSLARTLVEKCVHLEAQDHDGYTPLHLAAAQGLVNLVRLLFERGADLEATDHEGFTPLFLAVCRRMTKVLPFLLDSGANVEVTDNEGKSLLFFAVATPKPQIVEMLLNFGAKVEVTDKEGKSPLFFAVAKSKPQIVEMLLNFGANVECTGKGPFSPLKKAVEVIEDNLNTANGILRKYEMFKERISGLETRTEIWALITADSPEMARLRDAWRIARAKESIETHQILRRAVADTGIDRLDEEVERLLDRAVKDVDQALEEMRRIRSQRIQEHCVNA